MLEQGFYNLDCMEGMKQFPDKFFDLAIVDPPYGINITSRKSGDGCQIGNGGKVYHAFDDTGIPGPEYFKELFRVSKNQIIWGGNYFTENLPPSPCWICWDKLRRDLDFADGEMAWTSFKKPMRVCSMKYGGNELNPKLHEDRIHPTQKPVRLYDYLLSRFSEPGDKILDTHVGSASSLIACYRSHHPYWGFEIDPVFFRDASERLENAKAQISLFD